MAKPEVHDIVRMPCNRKARWKSDGGVEYFVLDYDHEQKMVYFPLQGIVALVNEEFVKRLNANDPLVESLFGLVGRQKTLKVDKKGRQMQILYLELTTDCNFRCTYCFKSGGDNSEYMNWETAKASIDWMLKRVKGSLFVLEFNGGEPLLAFELMQKCHDYAKKKCDERGVRLVPFCITNGTMLDEKRVKWFKEAGMMLQVSFDGHAEVQNKQRPFRDGRGSHAVVSENIRLLNKHGVDYFVSVCVTEKSLPKLGAIIRELYDLGVERAGFSPVFQGGRCTDTGERGPSNQEFDRALARQKKIAEKEGIGVPTPTTFHDMERGLEKPGVLSTKYCKPFGETVIVATNGDITSCVYALDSNDRALKDPFYGKVEDGKVRIDWSKFNAFRNRTSLKMEPCKDCFSKYACAGGCPLKALRATGSINTPSPEECARLKQKHMDELVGFFK